MVIKKSIPADSGTDALDSYLRQLGIMETPDASAMQELWSSFGEASFDLHAAVTRFGVAAFDMIQMLDRSTKAEISLSELFFHSSFPSGKMPSPLCFQKWRGEICAAAEVLANTFASGKDCSDARENLSRILRKYPTQSGITWEYVGIIGGYAGMIFPDFDLVEGLGKYDPTEQIDPSKSELVSKKLLMHPHELPAELEKLCSLVKRYISLRDRILNANLRLVVSIAVKYRSSGVDLNDLIQEGNLGLMHALERFDFKRGYKFSTYAVWWIRHNIFRIISEQSRIIRLPGHMIRLIRDIRRNEQDFLQLHGREPENHELAKIMELPEARISAVRKMAMQSISLQTPVFAEDDNVVLEELISDASSDKPGYELARKILYDRLREMLNTLPEREQQIIIMRFGLFGSKAISRNEISRQLNLSKERVRQLEIKTLALLRSPEKLKYIDGCIHQGDF